MSTTNTIQIALGEESPLGTPATEMELIRLTGETVTLRNSFITSEEIRADRQPRGDTLVDAEVTGQINFYLTYGGQDERIAGAFMSSWTRTPSKDNGPTADSQITGVTASTNTIAVDAGGASFKAGMLVRTTGFTNAGNNGTFKVASSTGTTIVLAGTPGLADESAPPAKARIKVVGFEGEAGGLEASSTGLFAATIDLTTMGILKGDRLKIGGTDSGTKFATAALNTWVRVAAAPTTNAIVLDQRPSGWTTDNGAAKTIRVWFGNRLRNGATKRAWTLEKGFMSHTPPSYLVFNALMMGGMTIEVKPGTQVTGNFPVSGTKANSPTTTPIDSTPSDPPDTGIMNGVTDVGMLAEGGNPLQTPNYITEFTFVLNNNLLQGKAVGVLGSAVVEPGPLSVTGNLTTYFGDTAIWAKIVGNTKTSLMIVLKKDNQSYVLDLPAVRLRGDAPAATRTNEWATINSSYVAEYDATMGYTAQLSQFEYVEG